jgi:hypothetical protein
LDCFFEFEKPAKLGAVLNNVVGKLPMHLYFETGFCLLTVATFGSIAWLA